jgi:tetratricopeptide (TPR) repeat protein
VSPWSLAVLEPVVRALTGSAVAEQLYRLLFAAGDPTPRYSFRRNPLAFGVIRSQAFPGCGGSSVIVSLVVMKNILNFQLLALVIWTLMSGGAVAQSAPEPEHHHHRDGAESQEVLGQVTFPTSCAARSQEPMRRGVALLHSFGYSVAQMQFEAIAKDDPGCAMAHWGIAMTQFHELWGGPGEAGLKLGRDELAKARAIVASSPATMPIERAYIEALSAFYEPAKATFQQRADAYEAKMNALHKDFPDDVEAAAFDALSMLASVAPDDTSLTHEHAALAILVPLFAAHPDHPGLAHYIIHTCDTPSLAADGLSAAREYAKIAPSSPHALHMPGHIFARLGMWQEDIDSNLASVAASEKAEAAGKPGSAHQMHAEEFLIYAYLQTGQDEKAHELTARMRSIGEHMAAMPGMDDMKGSGHYFDDEVNAIYAIEMHQWKELTGMKPAPGSKNFAPLYTYWGQGIAAGHLQDAKTAAKALKHFDKALRPIEKEPNSFSAKTVMRQEMIAWQEFAGKHPDAAVEAMRKAADQQDKLGQNEVDIPAREMLGDLLVMEHKPEEALAEYRVSLKLSPNRLNGLLGAGVAAEQAKHPEQAREYYAMAARQTENGKNSQRPELARAVEFVAAR